jgi:hypothetical protein
MARQLGGGQHDKRSGVEDTMQGDWVADGTTRGGWADNTRGWWLTASGGGRRGCTQDVLEIVLSHFCDQNQVTVER